MIKLYLDKTENYFKVSGLHLTKALCLWSLYIFLGCILSLSVNTFWPTLIKQFCQFLMSIASKMCEKFAFNCMTFLLIHKI